MDENDTQLMTETRVSRSANTSRGGLTAIQHKHMLAITQKLMDQPISVFFHNAVSDREAPNYSKVIKKPIWLNKVMEKLNSDVYGSVEAWKNDINLIWKNAKTYNREGPFFAMAAELENLFKKISENIPTTEADEWVIKLRESQAYYEDIIRHRPVGVDLE